MRPAVQLYTLRDLDETLPETIHRFADTPYEGVQFAGLGDNEPEEVAVALTDAGLDVAGAHVAAGFEELEADPENVAAQFKAVGADRLVVPSYDREAFETAAGAREAGERVAAIADRLADVNAEVHYHNHTFEFTDLGGRTAFDVFAEAADGVKLEVDTGLANHGGVDPVELLDRYGDRVSLVHLTDSRAGEWEARHADLGTGEVDLQACVDACGDAGVDWLIFEHGLTDDPLGSTERAAETMLELLGR